MGGQIATTMWGLMGIKIFRLYVIPSSEPFSINNHQHLTSSDSQNTKDIFWQTQRTNTLKNTNLTSKILPDNTQLYLGPYTIRIRCNVNSGPSWICHGEIYSVCHNFFPGDTPSFICFYNTIDQPRPFGVGEHSSQERYFITRTRKQFFHFRFSPRISIRITY